MSVHYASLWPLFVQYCVVLEPRMSLAIWNFSFYNIYKILYSYLSLLLDAICIKVNFFVNLFLISYCYSL